MREKKGITLIALIITIVIMLILVGVIIQIIINSGILGKAAETGQVYQEAQENEANMNEIQVDDKLYNSIDDYFEGKEAIVEVHNWTRNGDILTCQCTECAKENLEGRILQIGQELSYTAEGVATTNIDEEKSGMGETQTAYKSDNTKWLVLGIEDRNNNGTNETLLLTTDSPTKVKLAGVDNDTNVSLVALVRDEGAIYFNGQFGYNNGPEELDRMCRELYGENARSIRIEDVNNCLQYTPSGGIYYDQEQFLTTRNLTTKIKDLSIWDDVKEKGTYTPDGRNTEDMLGIYELNGYWYRVSDDGTYIVDPVNETNTSNEITVTTRDLIFGTNGEYLYWLATRAIIVDSYGVNFNLATVGFGSVGSDGSRNLFCSDGFTLFEGLPLRAVVCLSNEIPGAIEI